MASQLGLFSSRRRMQDMSKCSGYLARRCFALDKDIDFNNILEMTNCKNAEVAQRYVKYLQNLSKQPRMYEDIGNNIVRDNLYDLEVLGVGEYAKKYQIILSFDDCLDFFLHVVSGCNREVIRDMPHYHEVSSAILGLKEVQSEHDITFGSMFGLDPKLDEYFIGVQKRICDESKEVGDELIDKIAFETVLPMLAEIHGIQNYLISCISASRGLFDGNAVCRSRNFSNLVLTSDIPITDDLELFYGDFGSVTIKPKCYERYEYAVKEVLVCDNCRKC